MDPLEQLCYEQRFEIAFRSAKGNEFQSLFAKLMGLAYKTDYMASRPWGNRGDGKNDGFLKSERRLFQLYAPYEMTEAKTTAKITEDFEGAKVHWRDDFDKWVFAHNAVDGLPPHVSKTILDFERANPGITLEIWGLEQFLTIFRMLTLEDLREWFGWIPSGEAKCELDFSDLQLVVETIADRDVPPDREVRDVPPGKIEANELSDSVAAYLRMGMAKAPLVGEFFKTWYDETLGERVAESFRSQYRTLHGQSAPDKVFAKLQSWAGGVDRGSPRHELAILAVLAYYFDSCDIFEEPRGTA